MPRKDYVATHFFTKGVYARQLFMPAGEIIISKIHKTQHQYIISKGIVEVQIDMDEWKLLEAPFHGITEVNTRRVLYVHEDCIWTTFHPIEGITGDENELSDIEKDEIVSKIESMIIEPHKNELLNTKNNSLTN